MAGMAVLKHARMSQCGQIKRFFTCSNCNKSVNLQDMLRKSFSKRVIGVNNLKEQVSGKYIFNLDSDKMSSANFREKLHNSRPHKL